MEIIITFAGLVALVYKVVDAARRAATRNYAGLLWQVIAWVAGVLVVWIATSAELFAATPIPGTGFTIGQLDFASALLVGLSIGSLASAGNDFFAAVDGSRSSAPAAASQPPAN